MDIAVPVRRTLIVLLAALSFSVAPVDVRPVEASGNWVDTSDRDAVIGAYEAEFGSGNPSIGWTGNRDSCSAGTTNQGFRDAIFDRINYFRAMAGVPAGVTENSTYSAKAQQSALMMSESRRLSHNPDGSFACYTAAGDEAAGSSNLYLGVNGPNAIDGYIEDPGGNNVSVGHRNWILHPTTQQMGTGDIPGGGGNYASNTLWVFDHIFDPSPELRESNDLIAWPPRGFVPGELVYPRWSASIRGADFSYANVSVTRNGQAANAPVVHRSGATNGAPFPVVVFEPQGVDTDPNVDTTYHVTITGATVNGSPTTIRYHVTIIGDSASQVSSAEFTSYVEAAFEDFIGRPPTSNEVYHWTNQLAGGMTRYEFVQSLSSSDVWTAAVVDDLYQDTLGRNADAAGSAYWTNRLQAGSTVAVVASSFYGSPEYVSLQGGSHEQWVEDLYGVLLGRDADGGGTSYWTAQADAIGTGTVAYRFYQSQESREARVIALYQKFLNRNPDSAGLAYWADRLGNGDDLQLAANLAASDEYFNAAG